MGCFHFSSPTQKKIGSILDFLDEVAVPVREVGGEVHIQNAVYGRGSLEKTSIHDVPLSSQLFFLRCSRRC